MGVQQRMPLHSRDGYHGPPIYSRDDGNPENATLTRSQTLALEAVSLSLASISVFAAFIAFYWFVRMRRSFRQDLIMLLIQSDMMKAFWLVLCPIVYFIGGPDGPIRTESPFCQLSGFFLTAAINASDVSVLMIAIHSALYILGPKRSRGESGLYPYRRIAYTFWFVVPFILAALVPITGGRFVDTGPFCYLPTRPKWYRSYVNWVPRYIIFGVIFLVYASLYIHLAWRFRRLERDQRRASALSNDTTRNMRRKRHIRQPETPPTPNLASHGLLDSSPKREGTADIEQRNRQHSVQSDVSTLKLDDRAVTPLSLPQESTSRQQNTVSWNWTNMNEETIPDGLYSTPISPTNGSAMIRSPEFPARPVLKSTPSNSRSPTVVPSTPSGRPFAPLNMKSFWRQPLALDSESKTSSRPTLLGVLQRGPSQIDPLDPIANETMPVDLSRQKSHDALRKSRDKISRQLRLLFIYPLIYIVVWIAPFVSHVYKYDSIDDAAQPFSLFVASVASLCLGAAVDSCFFSAWEQPWRHLQAGFWEALAMRFKLTCHAHIGSQGRTREEQQQDTRTALHRRLQEDAERKAAAALTKTKPLRRPREWWDLEEDALEN